MTLRTAVMTIASANYLPYVKTLMSSVRTTNPDYRRYLFLADEWSDHVTGNEALFETVEASRLGIDPFEDMALRYDVMEFNTAIKPFAIDWLFENTDVDIVIYLDPDIRVYRRLTELEEVFAEGSSVAVTPHLTRPQEDGKSPNDYHMLQAGVFNLGFIAVSRQTEARDFIRWWSRRLQTLGFADFARNIFTDQRWVDLAPCFLANLKVFRDLTYNVAYWNLPERPARVRDGTVEIAGRPLAFFHFSGLEVARDEIVSKHQTRLDWNDIKPLHALFRSYRAELNRHGWASMGKVPYRYNVADDLKISPIVRQFYRELNPEPNGKAELTAAYIASFCNGDATADRPVTPLMRFVHQGRPDLQAAFRLSEPGGDDAFGEWFRIAGPRDYGLDARLCQNLQSPAVAETISSPTPGSNLGQPPNQHRPLYYRQWRKLRKWVLQKATR